MLVGCGGIALSFVFALVLERVGAAFARPPTAAPLSAGAQALVARSLEGIQTERLLDHHVHLMGLGAGGSGNWVNPRMRSWRFPLRRLRFGIYLEASGIDSVQDADEQYLGRLMELIEASASAGMGMGRYLILAFDRNYHRDGRPNLEHSEFYTPNESVFSFAERFPQRVVPAISINPYRKDALVELEKWSKRGARFIKWLPNAMGIDPADPKLDSFYDAVREQGAVILTHVGEEKAVESEETQRYGNPLRFRRALERGVKVLMAHGASLGQSRDLDNPEQPYRSNFDLFLRLMDESKYEGLLWGEISAVVFFNRYATALRVLLERKDLHPRLVNGSDYPLPAINFMVHTGSLHEDGFISAEERAHLNEIYVHNPLLFDFVLKRTLRVPGSEQGFGPEVFYSKTALMPEAH